jgi:hypothetical protein
LGYTPEPDKNLTRSWPDAQRGNRGSAGAAAEEQRSLEAIMAALIIVIAFATVFGILFGGFIAICRSIRRVDKYGSLQQAPAPLRHLTGAYSSRWDSRRYA